MARLGRISRRLAGAGALAAAGVLTFAGVASAHNPGYHRDCTSFTLDFVDYPVGAEANWFTLTVDGKDVITHQYFSKEYKSTSFPATPTDTVTFHVHTNDDPTEKNHQWSGDFTIAPPPNCPSPSQSASASASASASVSASASASASASTPATSAPATSAAPTSVAPVAATSKPPVTPAPATSGPALAFTGGGSDAGMIAGIGAAVVVVGAGIVVVARRRSAPRH
ncbi:LAETG motif-containing sortase-dependent surface protein [Kitasatospora viridis]|uniref:LAETG motif-containing sortase-dependent surface protein n=1 Tax=Kitasatospora viridis TaxID=281105 RepID=UPI00119E1EEB|nr:LAETG motif-containing sortase-dependent surface protein [Kitasatospora viridis]